MKRYKYDQLRRAQEKKLYYKMYKAGKNWIIAGLTMVGFSFMFSMAAKADVDEQQPNTENLDTQAEKEQQNIAQVTSTDTNEQLVVTETPTTSNNEPKENEATPAKVETGENTVESAKQPEPQVATNEVVASRAEDTTPVIRRARTVASTTAVTEDDIDQKTVRTENMIDWLQDGLFSGDNKNALTTPILPNDQNGKRNNQAPFNINSAAMSQLSYNTLYYPFVKKLQAAYKAEDYKELTNMAAILQAIYGKVNTEQLITGIFTPEDNYKADQALANAKLNRSVAVIVSMDQDGHILSQSVGLPDSFVTGSGGGYKVEDGSLEDTGYISWPSAILDIVVGKNGTDMISYDPARAATIPNDPPKTLGVYKYIGSEYYHSTVNQDLIKYADNDPMKTKFAVADYSANKKKIIPEGHALTYIINRYQTQVAPVDKTAQTTITYKGNKGNVLTVPAGSQVNLSGKEGQEVEIPTPPTIKGYTFNFPRFNGQRTSVGSKVTLEKSNELIYFYIADPVPAKVTVAYKSGDTVLTPATPVQLTGNIDDEVSVPSPPTISGYTFNNVLLNGETSSIGATVTLAENNTLVYNYRKDAADAVTEVVYQNVNGESQTAVLGKIDTRSIPKKAGLKYTITDGPEAVIPGKGIQPAMKILFNGQEVTKGQVVTLLEKNTLTYIFPARTTTPTQKPAVTTVSYKAGTETLDPTTPVTLTGNVGTKVNVPTAPTVIGYTLEKVKFNGAEVPVGSQVTLLATNTLEYSYTKDPEVATTTVEYKSGETPVTPTTSVTLTGNVGSEVTVPTAPTVVGYHYVNATFNGKAVTPNSKVTLEKANKLVYNYVKDPEVATTTVEYKSGETPVTPTTPVTLTGNVGTKVSIPTAPTVTGYTLEKVKFNGTDVSAGSLVTLLATNTLEYSYTKDPEAAKTMVNYKAGTEALIPTALVTLTGNVGDEVTVPTAPVVSGYTFKNMTFNGTEVKAGSKVTLEKTNTLAYNYTKNAKQPTTSNVTIYYRDVNDSKDDKYTANSGTLLAQYTQALRGEVGNVYANTLSEVEQAGYMVAKSDTGVLSGSYLANDATYYVYLTHAKKEQTHQVTVTRTIQYQDETGSSVAKAVEQKQVFDVTEMVDQVNKQVVSTKYAPANATFEQVISPVKDGYIFEKAVPAKEITATSPSETVTVGYKAQPQKLTYTVVDKDEGDKVLVKEQLLATGTTDQVLSATAKDAYQAVVDDYRKAGYKVVELPELPSSFDTDPTNDQNLVFVLAHDTKKVPGKSKEVAVRVTYRYGNGPKQGESAAKTKEQFLTFTSLETRDAVTDKVLETKWSEPQQSDTFKSPNVVNYVADKKQVGALEVTAAMGPQNLEVNYYTAQAKEDLETPWGELPVASSVIQNTAELAQLGSKTYIWKKQPNVEPIGYQSHTSEGVVSVVYADGTEQEVPVTVKVAPQAKNYAPKAKAETVTVSVGQLPAPESLIADFEQLPGGTKASWGVVPDVTKEGTSTGLIEVLYPDNTRDLVEVALEVKADLAKKETIPAKPFLAEMRENGEQKVGLSKKQVNDQSGEKLPQTGEKEDKVSIFGALVMTLAGALGMNVTIKKKRK